MKKIILVILGVFLVGVMTGCSENTLKIKEKSKDQIFEAEVIEGGEYLLVAPDEASDAYRSSDKISVALLGAEVKDSAGNTIGGDQLKAGDIVKITFNGVILESYPAQITANIVELIDHNILIDGYMALIDDIYQEDSGLNGDINMIAFDTAGWVELTGIEKEIILSLVKEKYGFETLQGTFDELAEQGLIDKENLYFEKGILIEISEMEYDAENKIIKGSISKWRSGKGAIGADAEARLEGDKWKITKTNQWIS
ncbi:MAG TPA: hypothetical protein VJ888_00760, partial [Mobilitalea sp.]|nr:hypothetical protein [Mobilitalea sp.]